MESYYMWVGALLVIALTLKYLPRYLSPSTPKISIPKEANTDANPLLETDSTDQKTEELEKASDPLKLKEFAEFQRWYIVIFLLVMLADWMQGPYVYKLYSSYNIPTLEIAILFIIGFGTSGVTGAFIGSLADKFG
eukprot:898567_1